MTTLDVHAHLCPRGFVDGLSDVLALPRTAVDKSSAALLDRIKANLACFDVSERVALMQRIGLDCQVRSPSIPFSYDGDSPTPCDSRAWAMMHCRSRAEQSGALLCVRDLTVPDVDALRRELERCLDQLHLVGVAFGSNVNGMRLGDQSNNARGDTVALARLPFVEPDLGDLRISEQHPWHGFRVSPGPD